MQAMVLRDYKWGLKTPRLSAGQSTCQVWFGREQVRGRGEVGRSSLLFGMREKHSLYIKERFVQVL